MSCSTAATSALGVQIRLISTAQHAATLLISESGPNLYGSMHPILACMYSSGTIANVNRSPVCQLIDKHAKPKPEGKCSAIDADIDVFCQE